MAKIAIILTTFLRNELAFETIQSIQSYLSEDLILLIGDQNDSEHKLNTNPNWHFTFYYSLPFDCGLSYARNYLINKVYQLQIPYILMSADSIRFVADYSFSSFIQFLESEPNRGIVGFDLVGAKCPWEWLMELTPQGIKLDSSKNYIKYNEINYKEVDICRNIFLAKTESILNIYDNEMKLCEHELAFLEYKKRGYKVYWTDTLTFKKIITETNSNYISYRQRFSIYRELLKKKLNISNWVIYSPAARLEINQYKLKQNPCK